MQWIKENKLLFSLSLACIIAIVIMIFALCIPKKAEQKAFVPPPFDVNAVVGEPIVPDGLGYSILCREGMVYRVGICGKINITANSADVYLTNVSENHEWLKVRFYDQVGHIIGESGLVRPGEYLKSITLDDVPGTTDGIVMKIMSYEPDTYNSLGTITLTPRIVLIEK